MAVPAGKGRKEFAKRAMKIAPNLANHFYVGGTDLRDRLITLYQHRSQCVHGMVPFLELGQRGDAGEEEAARLEFLAEALAREALRVALSRPADFPIFEERGLVEAAWASGQFP